MLVLVESATEAIESSYVEADCLVGIGASKGGVPASTSGARPVRSAPTRARRQALAERIRAVHLASHGTYGSALVTAGLRDAGMMINEKKVARVKRKFHLVGVHLRKRVTTTMPEPSDAVVPDLFQRDVTDDAPITQVTILWSIKP
ncbi:IS3 family transposase [Streptomyces yanii]|uniref:IS3 family transposase n=1 Tax=Streptomyces yanii TaxID=78510 RepID=A0ABV5R2A6_9ACTN